MTDYEQKLFQLWLTQASVFGATPQYRSLDEMAEQAPFGSGFIRKAAALQEAENAALKERLDEQIRITANLKMQLIDSWDKQSNLEKRLVTLEQSPQ